MDSPANHRSPWAKLCHYRFSISFRRFFFSFFFFLLFFPPSFASLPFFTSRSTPFLLTFLPRLLLLSSSRTFFYPFLLLLFSSFPLPFALPICVHRFSACRKVLPEVRRFYYRFASLTRRPIFTKKKKGRTILQQDFDDATIHIFLQYYIFR